MQTTARQREEVYRQQIVAAIRSVISAGRVQIPPYPTMALRLTKLLEQDDFALQSVVDVVKGDQSLSAQVLRHANTAANGSRQVTSLDRAISFMGMEKLMSLVTVSGLQSVAVGSGPLTEVRRAIWSRTVLRAHAAEVLARHRGLKADLAFICGLLADFGKVVTIRCIEQFLASQPTLSAMPSSFWFGLVQLYEGEIGLVIANKWNLPHMLQGVMKSIAARQADHHPLAATVLAADQVVGLLRSKSCVTAADLATLTWLRDDQERAFVLGAIPYVAEASAHLCSEATVAKAPSHVVSTELRWKAHLAAMPAQVRRAANVHHYQSRAIAYDGMELQGRDALPLQELVRLVVHTPLGELSTFGTLISAARSGPMFHLALSFFAMTREQKVLWDEVVKRASK